MVVKNSLFFEFIDKNMWKDDGGGIILPYSKTHSITHFKLIKHIRIKFSRTLQPQPFQHIFMFQKGADPVIVFFTKLHFAGVLHIVL